MSDKKPNNLFKLTIVGLIVAVAGVSTLLLSIGQSHANHVEVWKDPNCGCCSKWVEYMQREGFSVKVHDTGNRKSQKDNNIMPRYRSCHTAVVGNYAIEGHVPAEDIKRLLDQQLETIGLAVPGMVVGSPGMEYQGMRSPYNVLLLKNDGSKAIFASY